MGTTIKTPDRAGNIETSAHRCRLLAPGRRLLVVAALLLLLLTACGGGITQTGRTEHYNIQFTLDSIGFGERTANVEIHDQAGQPVTAAEVVLAPVMRDMGMAAPELTAQPLDQGRYQAKGQLFVMLGAWEVDVRISVGGAEEVASFKIEVIQP